MPFMWYLGIKPVIWLPNIGPIGLPVNTPSHSQMAEANASARKHHSAASKPCIPVTSICYGRGWQMNLEKKLEL